MFRNGKKTRSDRNNKYQEDYNRLKLKLHEEQFVYKPDETTFTFYQICSYPSKDKKHQIRKLFYDQDFKLLDKRESKIKKNKLDKFLKGADEHKYELIPTYEIDIVPLPSEAELMTVNSKLLNSIGEYDTNNDDNITGFDGW